MTTIGSRITGVRAVGIPVSNQDSALSFYEGVLGFEKLLDTATPAVAAGSNCRRAAAIPS